MPGPRPGMTAQGLAGWLVPLAGLFALCLGALPALAHPHVWITVKSEIVYAPDGRIAALRHAWTFDDGFSAYLSQGLDTNKDGKLSREELAGLAKENVESLIESNYFTVAKAAGKPIEVAAPSDYWMESDGKLLTLHFTIALKSPAPGRTFALDVYDPNYFIQFVLADSEDAVKLRDAPKGCTVSFRRPKLDQNAKQSMSESFFGSQSAADYGAQFASRAIAACP